MIALTKAQVFLALALSLHSVRAFEPTFSAPRQCESLSISWSSVDLPTSIALTEITMSLIPLDSNPAHFPPEPYTLAVPVDGAAASAGSVSIASLPFPAGTDFFAQAYIPGMSGPTKRTVSGIMKVGHSAISDCLPVPEGLDKRKVKQFGKRQISVIGPNTVGTADLNATPAATPSANTPINVIGVGQVPANGSSDPAAGSSSAPASASSGAPPIGVIGTQVIPATPIASSEAPPVNAVPPPSASSSGPVAPVNVIGTSFVDATPAPGSGSDSSVAPAPTDSASFVPNFTTDQAGQQDATTSCTSTWATETAQAETTTTDCTTTTWETAQAEATSTDCTTTTEAAEATATQDSSYDSSYGNSYDNSSADSETTTSCTDEVSPTEGSDSSLSSSDVPMPSPTQGYNGESNASSYGSFDDMVNAANEMFHAWNPYKPVYTPST